MVLHRIAHDPKKAIMADAATAELTLAEEYYSLSKRELGSLKRILAKRNDAEIFASICRLGAGSNSAR